MLNLMDPTLLFIELALAVLLLVAIILAVKHQQRKRRERWEAEDREWHRKQEETLRAARRVSPAPPPPPQQFVRQSHPSPGVYGNTRDFTSTPIRKAVPDNHRRQDDDLPKDSYF